MADNFSQKDAWYSFTLTSNSQPIATSAASNTNVNPSHTYYSTWPPVGTPSIPPSIPLPRIDEKVPPTIQVRLDARDMIDALRQYRLFLQELDDMDAVLAQIVDDTIFGLTEAIEALEKLGYKET